MISNSCKNSNQYTVVNLFIDIAAGLVLSIWFILDQYITLKKAGYNCEANDVMHDELFMHVKCLLKNRLHGKAAKHS